MYRRILVALDHTAADESMIPHVSEFARMCGAELLLVHVADGWAARHYHELNLADSEEMVEDRAYLEKVAEGMRREGLRVQTLLAMGDPVAELLKTVVSEKCDLMALTTHGHRLIGDLVHGSTIDKVRHNTDVPLLIVRAGRK